MSVINTGAHTTSTVIADLLIPFCEAACLNIKDVSRTVRKRILVSLSFVDNTDLHQRLFKEHHIDWNGASDYLQDITYTPQDWLHIIKLLDFVQVVFLYPFVHFAEIYDTGGFYRKFIHLQKSMN